MKTKSFFIMLLALVASINAKAANGDTFRIDVGDGEDHLWLTLTVLDEDQQTAEVTSTDHAWGTCDIPATANGYTVVSIGDNAFKNQTDLVKVVIPSSVTNIGVSAFEGCTALGTLDNPVVVPTSVISVGVDAFKGTWWLDYTLPNGVIYINNILYIYKGEMPANTTIDIAEGTTSILSGAFQGCTGLTSITIPASVTEIGDKAFYDCFQLSTVTVASGTPVSITATTFTNISTSTLYVPNYAAYAAYRSATNWKNFMRVFGGLIAFEDDYVKSYCVGNWDTNSDGEIEYDEAAAVTSPSIVFDNTKLSRFHEFKYFTGVTTITANTFMNSTKFDILLPATITSISDNAFPKYCFVHFESTQPVSAYTCDATDLLIVPCDALADYKTAWPDLYMTVAESDLGQKSYIVSAQSSSSALQETIGAENTLRVVNLKVSGTINSYDMMVMRNKLVNLRELDLADASIVANSYNYGTGVSEDNVFPDFLKTSCITSIVLPNTITSIGDNAFKNENRSDGGTTYKEGPQLETITIPASVTSIGSYAFFLSNITTVNMAENSQLNNIGSYAFYHCGYLQNLPLSGLPTSIGSKAFEGCTFTTLHLENCTIYANAFKSTYLKSLTVIGGKIYPLAFESCTNLQTIDINTSLVKSGNTESGTGHFRNCTSLKNVTINVPNIYKWTFQYCPIQNLVIKGGIIEDEAFDGGIVGEKPANGTFAKSKLKSVTIEEGVTTIGNKAFRNGRDTCEPISIIIPESVTSIGESAFQGRLTGSLVLPRGITEIPSYAFYECDLTSVKLSPNTTKIGTWAFAGFIQGTVNWANNIEEIHLPSTLTTIEAGAFKGCSKLKSIYAYMPDIIPIDANSFPNYQTSTLYVPSFLYNSYYYDTNWSQFLQVLRCDLQPGDYETFYSNSDVLFAEGAERITEDTPIATIGSQGSITVEGEAQEFDTVDQTVEDSYSASLIGDGTTAADNNIPMNELRVNITVAAKKWYFFCFPFDVTIAECTYPGRYAWRYYDGATRAANGSGGWKVVNDVKLNAHQGYAFQSETGGTLVVRCAAPTFGGNRPQTLTVHTAANAQNASWNFVGNPYSSYYDFGTDEITSPITVWNGSSYTAYRPGDDELHLRPYQAFFIQKPEAADAINFTTGHRESYRQSQQTAASRAAARKAKGKNIDRLFLNITISDNDTAAIDRTRLVLNEKASHSYELECDAAKFLSDDAAAQVYMVEDGIPMAIDERPAMGDICLGYVAKSEGTLRLEAERMDVQMVLYDNETGKEFNLANGAYEFTTAAGTFNNRFTLRKSGEASAISSLKKQAGVAISTTDGELNIANAEGKTVEVYTVGGSLVMRQDGNGTVSLTPGVYVVKVNGVSTKVRVD